MTPTPNVTDAERIAGIRAQMRALGTDDSNVTDAEIEADLRRDPPLSHEDLVNAKWGLTKPSQRALAETALYWHDEARALRIMLGWGTSCG